MKITEPGFRTKSLNLVTTLTDPEPYSVDDLSTLYRQRWDVELDIRSIKVTMGMDELRCRTPEMVRKEIWACLLAYNLIRQKMLQSAKEQDLLPRKLSLRQCASDGGCWLDGDAAFGSQHARSFAEDGISQHRQSDRGKPSWQGGTASGEEKTEGVSITDDDAQASARRCFAAASILTRNRSDPRADRRFDSIGKEVATPGRVDL